MKCSNLEIMSIYNNIFTSIRLTNIKIIYAYCIITNRNKRWSLLLHYRNIDFLVRSHSCCRPILYFKQMRNSVFFSNKIKTVPYSIQFYCNFFLKYYPSFILKFSDSPIDSFLTFLVWRKPLCLPLRSMQPVLELSYMSDEKEVMDDAL